MRYAGLMFAPFLLASSVSAQEDSFDLGAMPPPKAPPPLFVNSIEGGIGYLSTESFHIGRYGGPTDRGPFMLLKGFFSGGDAWNSDGKRFWDASVNMYGFDTLAMQARAGQQGAWRMGLSYDSFVRTISDTARSPFWGVGSDRLTLSANWITGASSLQFAQLSATGKPVPLSVSWRSMGGDFVLTPREGYEIRLQVGYRNREGLRPQSLAFGQEGNFSVGVFFPQPIDYDTHTAALSLSYVDPKLQVTGSYTMSLFTSAVESITVPNPYSRSLSSAPGAAWPGGAFAGYPIAVGQFALPPDSAAHQVLVTGGYAVTPKTRITLRLSYTLQTQDDAFFPYTANNQLLVRDPLPRTSLDGKVRKTHIALNVGSREWRNVDLSARYTLDRRRNLSPMDVYSYVANDAQDQIRPIIPGNSRYIRLNLPHSFTFHQAKAEAGYRVLPRTRVSVAYTGDFQKRDMQQVARTTEHSFRAKVLTTFASGSAWAASGYATRNGSRYDDAIAWELSHTQAYLSSAPSARSIEQPLMRKYNLADRRRIEAKTGFTMDVVPNVALSAAAGISGDDYLRSPIGLTSSRALNADSDLSYAAGGGLTASLFYGYERIRANQNGYLIFDTVQGNPLRNWNVKNLDHVHSAGARLSWQARPDVLKFDASYTLSDATSRIRVTSYRGFLGTASSPLPAARDITHTGTLVGEYAFRPATALRLGYTVARHTSRDWQYANLGLAPVAQVLGSGIEPPRYTAHMVWMTTRYQF